MHRSGSVSKGPDYLYYDLTVTNRSTTNSFNNNHLVFKDIRQSVLIQSPEEYLLSVVRFQLDTTSLPVHRFEVKPNQNDPNLGIYSVTLEYFTDAVTSTAGQPEDLEWAPVNLDISVPVAPVATPNGYQVDSPYYYSYSFEHMVRLTNDALLRALDKLKLLVGGAIDNIDEPYLAWNTDRQSASLFCFKGAFNQKVYPQIKIYFNRPLYFLFNSLPVIELSHNITKNRNYQIVVLPYKTQLNGVNEYIVVDQEYSVTANWTPISSIVFTTTMPIVSNAISDPVVYEDNKEIALTSGLDESVRIISDFITDQNAYRSNLLYVPGEYRYISMYNAGPIRSVDVAVYWRTKYGVLKEFYLDPQGSCSMKLMFQKIKKDLL